MPYTAYVALRDATPGDNSGGVWVSVDFEVTGAQPTWTKIVSGLAANDVHVFRADPFEPVRRQYLQLVNAEQEIYRRDTNVGAGWTKIMDLTTAKNLIGDYWGPPNEANTRLEWIAPDTQVQGRLRCLLSNQSISPQNHDTYVMRSDDYGASWSWVAMQFGGLTHFPARGAKVVEGHGSDVWVAIAHPLVPTMRVMYSADGGGSWLDSGQIGTATQGYYQIRYAPAQSKIAYVGRFSTTAASRDLMKLDATGGSSVVVTVLQDTLDLAQSYTQKTGIQIIDHLWIDPTNRLHQRMQANGKIFVTNDEWATVVNSNPATLTPIASPTIVSDLITPNDIVTPIILAHHTSSHGVVQSLTDESDTSLENRSGTNWATPPYTNAVPDNAGEVAYFGLWVGKVLTKEIRVYAVELGSVGTQHGTPMHGDRSAWDVDGYPPEHASDIAASTPHYHAPYPGSAGQVVRSTGVKWQSATLTLADMGIVATRMGEVLISVDGAKFHVRLPVTDADAGWLVDGATGLLVVSESL